MTDGTMQADDQEWLEFRGALERAVGVPLWQYKQPQMRRRLNSLMHRYHVASWPEFAKAITADVVLLQNVQDTLTINVSEFYRQADRFIDLQERILPAMLAERKRLRIWSAGCSIGCEPYTLSILLDQLDPHGGHQVVATDVDEPILARAKEGTGYFPAEVRAVPPDILEKYFLFDGTTYRVVDSLKKRVTFQKQDLLKDAYPADLDLILCRNVVIYFTEEAKKHIYAGFSNALRPGGMLFVGGSEMIMRSHELGLRANGTSIYAKAA